MAKKQIMREDPIRARRYAQAAEKSIKEHGHTGRLVDETLDFTIDISDLGQLPLPVLEQLPPETMTLLLDDQTKTPWHGAETSIIDLVLTREADIVRIRGSLKAMVKNICVRCLDDVVIALELKPDLILSHTIAAGAFSEGIEFAEGEGVDQTNPAEDLDLVYFDGKKIALDTILREQIFLELPAHPDCSQGRESKECDIDKHGALAKERAKWSDPRWDGLLALKEKLAKKDS